MTPTYDPSDSERDPIGEVACSSEGCSQLATHKVEIRVWAKGHDRKSHPPLKATIEVGLCRDCAVTECSRRDKWINREMREMLDDAVDSMGKAKLDWKNARMASVEQ